MVLATFGDIHGNWPALEAAIAEIDDAGIRTIACTGDLVAGYPYPNEVIDFLERRNLTTVQGSQDRMTASLVRSGGQTMKRASEDDAAAMRWTYNQLTSENVEYLRALPRVQRITIDGVDVYVGHGAPDAVNDGIGEDTNAQRLERYRESARADIVIGGNTHQSFHRLVEDTLFVNPGSLGSDERGAVYAVVSTEQNPWTVEYRVAAYDREAVEEAVRNAGLPMPVSSKQ
jgi:putative phosphoesterase